MELKAKNLPQKFFKDNNYIVPTYDIEKVRKNTLENPRWIHFGAGNIFRAYPARLLNQLLNKGVVDYGLIVAEGYDYEIIDKVFTPFDNLTLSVTLKADGSIEKEIIGSMVQAYRNDPSFKEDFDGLINAFEKESLQMVSFTITEKGYELKNLNGYYPDVTKDFETGLESPKSYLGKVVYLLHKRFTKGAFPVTLASMDNYSHNGDKLKASILEIANKLVENNKTTQAFVDYLENNVSYPWSMIDKITPRPNDDVAAMIKAEGFDSVDTYVTTKNTYVSPFVNAEETEYLVIEDNFKNGKLPLDLEGVIYASQETVDKIEKMKVTTCLNPLHTSLAIFGCLLDFGKISEQMKDQAQVNLISAIGYKEGLPVVVDPVILNPKEFLDTVVQKRLPNPFMPDTPQRIATDTSQKISIRFGETIKSYIKEGLDLNNLNAIPLTLAAWVRYLTGVNDELENFERSSDPMLEYLTPLVSNVKVGTKLGANDLDELLSNEKIFGVDLVKVGLSTKVIDFLNEINEGKGSIRKTLDKYYLN